MNTTSLEISKRLYDLSDWDDVSQHYDLKQWGDEVQPGELPENHYLPYNYIPAYDLGYLLRKLEGATIRANWHGGFVASHDDAISEFHADTPEDAAGLLAIKLFEEGVLK